MRANFLAIHISKSEKKKNKKSFNVKFEHYQHALLFFIVNHFLVVWKKTLSPKFDWVTVLYPVG
jgi:hypothetical protein